MSSRPLVAFAVLAGCGRLGFDLGANVSPGDGSPDGVLAPCAPTAGLVGSYGMDADDVVGGVVHDRSGNGHDGVVVGSPPPSIVPGKIGEALDYAGTSIAYVDLPGLPLDTSAGATNTVSLWFRHDDPNVDETIVYLPPGPGTAPPRYDLWLTDRIGTVSLCINSGIGDCWGITDANLVGRWVHVAAVFANGPTIDGTLYVDGAPVTMSCRFGPCDQSRAAMTPVTIGGSDSSYAWHGRLDEVRFHHRALTPSEVQDLYACAP